MIASCTMMCILHNYQFLAGTLQTEINSFGVVNSKMSYFFNFLVIIGKSILNFLKTIR